MRKNTSIGEHYKLLKVVFSVKWTKSKINYISHILEKKCPKYDIKFLYNFKTGNFEFQVLFYFDIIKPF